MKKVGHFEIPVDDKKRAQSFYKNIFGWKMKDMDDMNYTMVHTTETDDKGMTKEPGGINGGLFERTDTIMHPTLIIEVPDIDKTIEEINKNGGSVVMPKKAVGDMGFVSYFEDTENNLIGIWENAKT